jgi:lysozyme
MAALGNLVRSTGLRVAMTLSAGGAAALIGHEAIVQTGYLDSVGVPTACIGHTRTAVVGKYYPLSVCKQLFGEDVKWAEDAVNSSIKTDLTQSQFDALVSFCFSVGKSGCTTSTLFSLINKSDYAGAANQFDRWVYSTRNGKKLDCRIRSNQCYGLYLRRMDEKKLFASGAY